MEPRGCRCAADRGATPPCRRGREAARPRPGLRGRPCTGAGGGPAGERTAFLFPFPLPAFLPRCAGSFVLPAAARRNRRAERPRRSALRSRGRVTCAAPTPSATLPPPRRVGPPPPPPGHRRFKRRATPGDGPGRARPPGSPTWCGARVSRPPAELGAHGAGQPPGLSCCCRRCPGGRSCPRPCASAALSGRAAGLHRRRVPR